MRNTLIAWGGGCDPVLTGSRLGDDAGFTHVMRQQRLSDRVIDFMCARVVQIFALEQDTRTTGHLGQPPGKIDGRRPPDIVRQVRIEPCHEIFILTPAAVGFFQLVQRMHQGLGHVGAAIGAKMTVFVRLGLQQDRVV
jgi:hypothetical protein